MLTPPVLHTKYPLLQRVLDNFPQNGNLCPLEYKKLVDLHLRVPIMLLNVSVGFVCNRKCIWSLSPLISPIDKPNPWAYNGKKEYKSDNTV